jgi:hypothetical protein
VTFSSIKVFEVIFLRFSMQREVILRVLMTNIMYLGFRMQEEDILEHTNVECHLCIM